MESWDFPGGAVVKTLCFWCKGLGFDSWLGAKIQYALQDSRKEKKKKERKRWSLISMLCLMQSLLSLYLEQFGAYFAFECI